MESKSLPIDLDDRDSIGRSYYIFCLEQALEHIHQARVLVKGDVTDRNHGLPVIERTLVEAIVAS